MTENSLVVSLPIDAMAGVPRFRAAYWLLILQQLFEFRWVENNER
jgi:hypothetical protein